MTTVLVTGADGFIGRNLLEYLKRDPEISLLRYDNDVEPRLLPSLLDQADLVFHLAGVNRPEHDGEFVTGNVTLTDQIVSHLMSREHKPGFILSSSIQATLENPYGRSKRAAEQIVERYGEHGGPAAIFRLPNVFGKWSRPNYNSVVATFCYNLSRGLAITISDPGRFVDLVYIDDVVKAFHDLVHLPPTIGTTYPSIGPVTSISLRDLVEELEHMRDLRTDLILPDMADHFRKCLYATYLSFLPDDAFDYQLTKREDARGGLAEILKSKHFGQMFISRTKPGVTRGNHSHDTKVEKFCVVQGEAVIRFRDVRGDRILTYAVKGEDFRVVDIPPGYTHSIENVGPTDMVVLFWSSEMFDPSKPDTYAAPVIVSETRR